MGDDATIPPGTVTIPTVSVSLADRNTIVTALGLGTVNATVGVNLTIRAGADAAGRPLIFTPNPVQGGSSVSHWDTIATPTN